ncbi:unnamed protein product (macronuclear) [Paramecium tetraurelia]|uniref:E3 ubiquitin protein ligase n=1 Tax=Paramecium tetraurelia TaxID=5888 RepID=A0BC88_PARTE|nr:uncharacterized protein GSPATT00004249001 [Paramecium tetraurelia]CAK56155.1 unnamed protein product [Paramecium tetraurelia]|eukprot:XP_001423553.1 hypothetical protein (macronuclear) [Paramecium tetraurelia strain d4-2]
MKIKKKNEQQRVTELGEHILKTQNTMLAAKIDQLKKEIQNMKSLPEQTERELVQSEELIHYKKLSNQLSRRIRIIMAYNEEAIQKKVAQEDIQQEKFECLCGANQIDSIKYLLVNGHQQILQQQQQEIPPPEENNQQTQSNQKDYIKKLIQESSEEKAQLLHQIEELKLQQKLPEEQFFQTQLFAELVQQNNYLTTTLFNIEEQLIQAQLINKEQLEKNQQQLQQYQLECEQKIKDLFSQQDTIKIEIKQSDDQIQNTLIEELKSQVEHSSKMIEDLKIELQQCRERNKEAQNQLVELINLKQTLLNQNNELKQYISVHKILSKDEKIEQVTLRYEKHKQLLYEIEQEYANTKSSEFIQRFREFVGYVKMRDEKVKGLEQQLEAKINDCNNIKKQIQQLIDELDYNSNSFNSINETNKNLSKLVNETQKNLSRAMQEKVDERIKFETERQQFQQKLQIADDTIKQLQQQNDQQKKLLNLVESEKMSYKETIRTLQKSDGESQQKLLQKEWDISKILEESKIIQEREKLSESINVKFIKKAEKSKSKLKYLKLQMKLESKDTDNELLTSLKMMVDCQQCKKRAKQVILMKCLHMFCKPCIDDNQKNRNRACPVCRAKYGIEEVKAIILN